MPPRDTWAAPIKYDQKVPKMTNIKELEGKILELVIAEPGISHLKLEKKIDVNRRKIARIRDSESFKAKLSDKQETAIDILVQAQLPAARKLEKLLESDNETIALNAAKELLKSVNPDTFKGELKTKDVDQLTSDELLEAAKDYVKLSESD